MTDLAISSNNLEIKKRAVPYIWVTWLSPLLAGENHCEWSVWLQANYYLAREQSNLSDWIPQHNRLLNKRVDELENQGFQVYIEGQNSFTIIGQRIHTKVAGKPDIVAIKDSKVIVEDCKTGQLKNSHAIQILLYMLLLPLKGGAEHCSNADLDGRLVYSDRSVDIDSSILTDEFKDDIKRLVGNVSNSKPARKVPSLYECRYCRVSKYCSAKIEEAEIQSSKEIDHELF